MKIKNSSSEMKVCNHFLYIYIEFRSFILDYVFVKLWGILWSFFCVCEKTCEFLSDRKWRYAIYYRFPLALDLMKIILRKLPFFSKFFKWAYFYVLRFIKITGIFQLNKYFDLNCNFKLKQLCWFTYLAP